MTVRCQNGHRIALRPLVGRDIPELHCWQCLLNPPEEDTMEFTLTDREVANALLLAARLADEIDRLGERIPSTDQRGLLWAAARRENEATRETLRDLESVALGQ